MATVGVARNRAHARIFHESWVFWTLLFRSNEPHLRQGSAAGGSTRGPPNR